MAKPARKSRDLLIVFFYIFIAVLILLFVVVTLRIAFSPVCSSDAQHTCVIDTWSIAGLTAAVFGIAAALLTFLGAFAVAYWWANLDRKVNEQKKVMVVGMKYKVFFIQNTMFPIVKIEAGSEQEAIKKYQDMWNKGEIEQENLDYLPEASYFAIEL